MRNFIPKLFVKIDNKEIFIFIGNVDEQNDLKIIEEIILPIQGLNENRISDIEKITDLFKKNILLLEQKINFTFKELVLILDIFQISFTCITGFKELNGSQVSKENITYIINSLKSKVDELEDRKKILHIFNSKHCLDKRETANLPIGLYGDYYSHELSFILMKNNDYKNLKNIFEKCNLKIKKILLESFVKGTFISDTSPEMNTFIHVQINENDCKIFYIESESLKYEQKFSFGSDMVTKDIVKITSLDINNIKKFIKNNQDLQNNSDTELLDQEYFANKTFRKIKKKLIFDIAAARIKELSEIIYFKNVNLNKSLNKIKGIYLEISDTEHLECFKRIYTNTYKLSENIDIRFFAKPQLNDLLDRANKIVQFGWKKEAIPITKPQKSFISRLFQEIFN